jgi:hypothetical protein
MDSNWLNNLSGHLSQYAFYYIILLISLIFIKRELTLWYFRINKIVSLLEGIDSKLDKLNGSELKVSDNTSVIAENKAIDINYETNCTEEHYTESITKASVTEQIKETLTKKYYISDLFSSRKKSERDEG